MPFAENLAPFFNTADFGTAATLNGAAVNGIFDNDYYEALGNTVEGSSPVFRLATSDASAVAHGQSLVIASTTYKVRGVEPDGTGVTLLRLEKQ